MADVPPRLEAMHEMAYSAPDQAVEQLQAFAPRNDAEANWHKYVKARALYYQNRFSQSLSQLIEIDPGISVDRQGELLVRVRRLMGQNYYWMGSLNQALLVAYEGEQAARTLQMNDQLAHIQNLIAAIHIRNGEQSLALDYFRESLLHFESAQLVQDIAKVKNNIAVAHIELGELDEAEPYLLDALRLGQQLGRDTTIIAGLVNLVEMRAQQGRFEEARDALDRCLALASAPDHQGSIVWCQEAAVELYDRRGDETLALAAARDVLERAEQQGLAQTTVDMAKKVSELLAAAGNEREALAYARLAYAAIEKVKEDTLALRLEQVNSLREFERTRSEVDALRLTNRYQRQRQWMLAIGITALLSLLVWTALLLRSKLRLVSAVQAEQGRTASALVEMRLAKEENERLARTDSLTGLANRRAAMDQLARLHLAFATSGQQYAILMIDIDLFKQINDRYGHDGGDLVLRNLAASLDTIFGEQAVRARWGGEEFLVAAPVDSPAQARRLAERLRVRADEQVCDIGQHQIAYSVSIGVALVEAGARPEQVIARADQALYSSKQAGRNRVTSHEPGQLSR